MIFINTKRKSDYQLYKIVANDLISVVPMVR